MDPLEHDWSHYQGTQQSNDFLASGELGDGTQAFGVWVPEVPIRGQEVAPGQLDVRPNYEPVGHDQAIAILAPTPGLALQASIPLAAPPVKIYPDNCTFA